MPNSKSLALSNLVIASRHSLDCLKAFPAIVSTVRPKFVLDRMQLRGGKLTQLAGYHVLFDRPDDAGDD